MKRYGDQEHIFSQPYSIFQAHFNSFFDEMYKEILAKEYEAYVHEFYSKKRSKGNKEKPKSYKRWAEDNNKIID